MVERGIDDFAAPETHRARSRQDQPYVHHVGIGGPRNHQVAERFEVAVGIVAFEERPRVRIAAQRVAVGDGAGRVGGAVGAVGAGAEDDGAGQARDIDGGGQNELLVAAAQAVALQRHGGLAAGDDAGGRTQGPLARDRGVHAGDLAGLAFDSAGQHQRPVAELPRAPRGRLERQPVASDHHVPHPREERIVRLGSLGDRAAHPLRDPLLHRGGNARGDAVLLQDGGGAGQRWRNRARWGRSRSRPGRRRSRRRAAATSTAAGQARRANWPPLMREMCLRTALISWIVAPQASSCRVTACFSSSVMPEAGSGSRAEAPPEIRQTTRSSCCAPVAMPAMRAAPSTPRASGRGWPLSFSSMRRNLARCPYLTLIRPAVIRLPRTRSAAFAIEAPALPAPTT